MTSELQQMFTRVVLEFLEGQLDVAERESTAALRSAFAEARAHVAALGSSLVTTPADPEDPVKSGTGSQGTPPVYSATARRILEYITAAPGCTVAALAAGLSRPATTVRRAVTQLVAGGDIVRHVCRSADNATTYWQLYPSSLSTGASECAAEPQVPESIAMSLEPPTENSCVCA